MAGLTPPPRIPLPRGWFRRVRSAVIHAISLANFSLTSTRSWAANSWNARIRLKSVNERLRRELALLQEEMRIKDSRMLRILAQRRPHYPPVERLAILELRAVRAWSLAQTARHLLVTTATVASWMGRLDEDGPKALVQIREPVNKFPEFVGYMVRPPTTFGIAISRRSRPPSASGLPGCPSPCLNVGPSAGGLPSPSITTRDESWDSWCSTNSQPPQPSGPCWDEPCDTPQPSRGISSRIRASSLLMAASGNGAVAAAFVSDSEPSASTAASRWSSG